ncbi:MAG: hypothetical protein J6Z11_04920 [Candidatus Riflebacteria bacterium]|nr:hypothetical protein [Candidatus Riflebacteria bacterium]
MKTSIKANLNTLHLSDIYSLMLFIIYKLQDIPEYAVLSEMCYLLDGANLTRLLAYFSGKTIKIPTEEEFATMANALLLYQYINVDGDTLVAAQAKLEDVTPKQVDKITELYLQILPIMRQYNIDRSQIQHGNR